MESAYYCGYVGIYPSVQVSECPFLRKFVLMGAIAGSKIVLIDKLLDEIRLTKEDILVLVAGTIFRDDGFILNNILKRVLIHDLYLPLKICLDNFSTWCQEILEDILNEDEQLYQETYHLCIFRNDIDMLTYLDILKLKFNF